MTSSSSTRSRRPRSGSSPRRPCGSASPTADQVDAYGLEVQRETIRSWAEGNGHRVVAWCADVSSGAIADRDGLGEDLELAHAGRARGIVFPRRDRLARDVVVQETLLAEIARAGGSVFSCS